MAGSTKIAAPRLLFTGEEARQGTEESAGEGADTLVVVRSSFWSFNGIGFHSGTEACVIDPGIYPEDIHLLGKQLAQAGAPAQDRRITHVLLTHSHHDHIRGWMSFPGATIVAPQAVLDKAEGPRSRILAGKQMIDQQLSIEDPDFRYPAADITFTQQLSLEVGTHKVELHFIPGHSNCCSMVWIPHLSTLCTADYLVSPGLPYCRWEATAFEAAIESIDIFVREHDVQRIVPAHNDPLIGNATIIAALAEERSYFQDLRTEVRRALKAGVEPEALRNQASRFMSQRRIERNHTGVGKRERQDLDNAWRVIQEEVARS